MQIRRNLHHMVGGFGCLNATPSLKICERLGSVF